MLKVKHPSTALVIWFLMGMFVYAYGIQAVAEWIVFVIGCVLIYTVFFKAKK